MQKILFNSLNIYTIVKNKTRMSESFFGNGNWRRELTLLYKKWPTEELGSYETPDEVKKAVVLTKQCRFGNTVLFYFVNTCFFAMCCQKI